MMSSFPHPTIPPAAMPAARRRGCQGGGRRRRLAAGLALLTLLLPGIGSTDEMPSVGEGMDLVPDIQGEVPQTETPAVPAATRSVGHVERDGESTPDSGGEAVYEFGNVIQGTVVQHSFELRNDREQPIRITDASTPCGCTAATVSDIVVATGGVGRIDVSFDTTQFRGRQTKTVFVFTDDPERPVRNLTLAGVVTADLVADPPVAYFGRVDPGAGAAAEIMVSGADGAPLDLVAEVASGNTAIDLDVEPPAAGLDGGGRVVVRIGAAMPRGPFS